jgi:hypothetical protein
MEVRIPCKFVTEYARCNKEKRILGIIKRGCVWPSKCELFESSLSPKPRLTLPQKPVPPPIRLIKESESVPYALICSVCHNSYSPNWKVCPQCDVLERGDK